MIAIYSYNALLLLTIPSRTWAAQFIASIRIEDAYSIFNLICAEPIATLPLALPHSLSIIATHSFASVTLPSCANLWTIMQNAATSSRMLLVGILLAIFFASAKFELSRSNSINDNLRSVCFIPSTFTSNSRASSTYLSASESLFLEYRVLAKLISIVHLWVASIIVDIKPIALASNPTLMTIPIFLVKNSFPCWYFLDIGTDSTSIDAVSKRTIVLSIRFLEWVGSILKYLSAMLAKFMDL